ncbi:MAG: chemotaxis protein CheC [Isosphaeraceae bacterium]
MTTLSETQKRLLATIFERGAESAATALSSWLGRHVRLAVSDVEQVALEEASDLLGPGDELVGACSMPLAGGLDGQVILVFRQGSELALADLLLQQPIGTTTTFGELEHSAACETTNIVGCAYLNSLAAHLPALGPSGTIVPGPPNFRQEFAASLLEFALMDQALESDRLLLVDTEFSVEETHLDWTLLFVPGPGSLRALIDALGDGGGP